MIEIRTQKMMVIELLIQLTAPQGSGREYL
jgi:hypothetical protein